MGLDITAYKKLAVLENPQLDEDGYPEEGWMPGASMEWSEKHFPGRGEGIDPRKVYSWQDSYGFRAGSYSGYNQWRSMLEQFMGDTAFQELINFADNEGVIGPVVSKKLAKDFADNLEKAKQFAEEIGDGDYWLEKYNDWKIAFEMASDGGAVEFH